MQNRIALSEARGVSGHAKSLVEWWDLEMEGATRNTASGAYLAILTLSSVYRYS